jgi:hypothetical protein
MGITGGGGAQSSSDAQAITGDKHSARSWAESLLKTMTMKDAAFSPYISSALL